MSSPLIHHKQAIEMIGVSPSTYWRYVSIGYIKTTKITPLKTKVDKSEVERFISTFRSVGAEVA